MTSDPQEYRDAMERVIPMILGISDDILTIRRINNKIYRDKQVKDFVDSAITLFDRLVEGRDVVYPEYISDEMSCPYCGECEYDNIYWDDNEFLNCSTCGTIYEPGDNVGGL